MDKPFGAKWERVLHAAELHSAGFTIPEIASQVGVVRRTIDRWISEVWWEDAKEEIVGGRHSPLIYMALANVKEKLEEGDPATTRWVLERGDRWFRNKKADDGEPAKTKPSANVILTDEDIAEYEELLNEDFEEPEKG